MAARSPRFPLRPFFWRWLMIALALATPAWGQEEPAARIAALVKDLGDASFTRRQHAEEILLSAGPAADGYLQEALTSGDPEVRARASAVVRRRRLNAVWQPTMLHFPDQKAVLGELEPLHWSGGARPAASVIHFPAEQLPLLEAYALAAEQLGCELESPFVAANACLFRRPTVRFHRTRKPLIVARSIQGPLGLKLVAISQAAGSRELRLDLQLFWEPGFELVSHGSQPESVHLAWGNADEERTAISLPTRWHVVDRHARPVGVAATLALGQPVDHLHEIVLKWPICAAAATGQAAFEHPRAGAVIASEAGELRIERWEVEPKTGTIEATLVAENIRSWPRPPEALLRNYDWSCHPPCAQQMNMCELTDSGCRWHMTFHSPQEVQRLDVAFRSEFTQKVVEFKLREIEVINRAAAASVTIAD